MDVLTAANAYKSQLKLMQSNKDGGSSEETANSPFAQLMLNTINQTVGAEAHSEALQTQSLTTGKVELSDLVTAVANAELSLNTVVAIRDRVINAYNDIIKMGI